MTIGPNGQQRPSNPVAAGVHIARIATGEAEEEHVDQEWQTLGRKGGKARADALTATERKHLSQPALPARWRKGA